ncbi:DUF6489 family protein [Novosphingobium sp.]|uniref:DUF6489 family protein n=1 Tax=Novosphingobium sp. TaxID=1874826 RepID=UPI003B5286AF
MKVNVEVECSPEEARRFLGLPDVTKAQEAYVEHLVKAMKGETSLDQLGSYVKQMAPMGEMGMKLFQQFMEQGAGAAMSGFKGSGFKAPGFKGKGDAGE